MFASAVGGASAGSSVERGEMTPNKSFQRTSDTTPIFASAKTGVVSMAADIKR